MVAWALLPLALVSLVMASTAVIQLAFLPWNHLLQLIPLMLSVVSLVLLYVTLRRLFNVTKIIIAPPRLMIQQGPLPRWKSSELNTENIQKIEVRPYTWKSKGRTLICYHLWAVFVDGKETCLLERDATEEQVIFARDEINAGLNMGKAGSEG